MKNNPIFQVLVVSNTTFLATGNGLNALGVGQIGAFNAETNVSFDPAGTIPDKFYLAVGHATDGIRKSAGEYIRRAAVTRAEGQAPVDFSAHVCNVAFSGFTPDDQTSYTVRVSLNSGKAMQMFGYDNPQKSFTILTGSVAPSLTAFIDLLVAEINADPEGILTASNVAGTTLRITAGQEAKETTVGGINPHYSYLRNYVIKVACTNGFSDQPSAFTIAYTPTEGPAFEQGSGYDIQQLEYVAGGWNGRPGIYRDSELVGLFAAGNFVPLAVGASKYYQLWLEYAQQYSSNGFLDYTNTNQTLIAVPNQDDDINYLALNTALLALAASLVGQTTTGGTVGAALVESATF